MTFKALPLWNWRAAARQAVHGAICWRDIAQPARVMLDMAAQKARGDEKKLMRLRAELEAIRE